MDQRRSRLGDGCTSDGEESAQPGGDRAGRVAAGIITALWLPRGRASLFSGAVLLFSHSVVSDSLVTPWTAARQAPLSIGFSRQEYRSGLTFPASGFDPGIKSASHTLQVDSLPLSPREG